MSHRLPSYLLSRTRPEGRHHRAATVAQRESWHTLPADSACESADQAESESSSSSSRPKAQSRSRTWEAQLLGSFKTVHRGCLLQGITTSWRCLKRQRRRRLRKRAPSEFRVTGLLAVAHGCGEFCWLLCLHCTGIDALRSGTIRIGMLMIRRQQHRLRASCF